MQILPKETWKSIFQVCHIIKILIEWLDISLSGFEKIRSKLVKYSSGLYVKPFNKIHIHACRNPRLAVKIIFSEHEVFKVVVMVTR